jgi:hypothetical protein
MSHETERVLQLLSAAQGPDVTVAKLLLGEDVSPTQVVLELMSDPRSTALGQDAGVEK